MALTKLNNKSVANVSTLPVALGDMILVSSATASGSATIDFTLGSYKEYQFYFVNIHPQTDAVNFQFNVSTDSGSTYAVTKTTTVFNAVHNEADSNQGIVYLANSDLAQSTDFQRLTEFNYLGADADQNLGGHMSLFNPSSSVFVKHFISRVNHSHSADYTSDTFVAGYANTTSALTNIRFQMSSGNIDAGTILMYGIN